jgi:outer membrane protein OmpA-like peptidoglycan-associated protein
MTMKRSCNVLLVAAVGGLLAACSSTPERIEELEVARAIVPQVEASPRAGVAATNVAEARKSLDRANKLADDGARAGDIQFEAQVAALNAQIANEKILTAQAQEEIERGNAERQAVLVEAREAEASRRAQEAQAAQAQAQLAEQRASTLEQELSELKAKKTDRGMVLTLGDVLFDTGVATLKPGAYPTIDRLATVLKEAPDRKVTIEGHTDSVGSEDFNQGLSERRAAAVQTALLERGVRSEQITALGKGESFPVASNDNAAGRQQNRRVEMIFSDDRSHVASDVY